MPHVALFAFCLVTLHSYYTGSLLQLARLRWESLLAHPTRPVQAGIVAGQTALALVSVTLAPLALGVAHLGANEAPPRRWVLLEVLGEDEF